MKCTAHANHRNDLANEIERRNSFSITNLSQVEGKLIYVQHNSETLCPPRGAVPVNLGRGWEFFTQHVQFAFGHRCDCPAMSDFELPEWQFQFKVSSHQQPMKPFIFFFLVALLLVGCATNPSSSNTATKVSGYVDTSIEHQW